MTQQSFISLLTYLEAILSVLVLVSLHRSGDRSKFKLLATLLSVRLGAMLLCLPLLYLVSKPVGKISVRLAYDCYFYIYWLSYALESILSLLVIYSIFRLAMAPLKGLQTLGVLVFRWAGAISVAVSIGMAISPHESGIKFMTVMVGQLQQTSSILTLCLLLFVCFAIRPMGLSYGSRIFGVSLGLGVMATISLVDSAWIAHNSHIYSLLDIVNGVAVCLTLLTWSAYFTFPEPKRRIIVLPTTSPFLRWNQISMALGDEPGFVAVGGIPPEVFAPAEIEIMRRASAKMNPSLPAEAMMSQTA